VLEHPWTVKIRYRRVPNMPRMINYDCEQNDRNPVIDGKLTVRPPLKCLLKLARWGILRRR
jgi:hypothetical protein